MREFDITLSLEEIEAILDALNLHIECHELCDEHTGQTKRVLNKLMLAMYKKDASLKKKFDEDFIRRNGEL